MLSYKIWYILRSEAQAKSHKRPMPGGAFRILDSMLRRGPLVLIFSAVYQSLYEVYVISKAHVRFLFRRIENF